MLADPKILQGIASTVEALAESDPTGFVASDIAQAMNAVYFASIRREEGEKVLPHLILLSEETLSRLKAYASILRPLEPETITPELLRKRALAFDRRNSSFLATPSEHGLEFAGVVHWEVREAHSRTLPLQLPVVCFDAEETGTISVAFGRTRLGIFRDGSFYKARPSVFTSPVFKRCLASSFFRLSNNDNRILALMTSLQYIVQEAMGHGLGGTIVVLDDYIPEGCFESGEAVAYDLPNNQYGRPPTGLIQQVFDRDAMQTSVSQLSEPRKSYLSFIARLSAIDGALVLNSKVEPIRYGTKLRAPVSVETVYLGAAEDQPIASVLKGVGTRHSSALNLVAHAKRAVAFTISSDGPVSTFGWLDQRLSWWKNSVQQ